MPSPERTIGVVAIGRNEGERLKRCLESIDVARVKVVYVDSGSDDGSVPFARNKGCDVTELDLSIPFTAARARNEGYRRFLDDPTIEFIQFVDGDCELAPNWLPCALAEMSRNPQAAAVCGRRREKFPEASVYNLLTDLEWDTPIGEADACGGDALIRVSALEDVDGYDESFAAGEEPDMCYRMRQHGWKIIRIDEEMTLHDAAMTTWKQWWMRSKRSGSAFAQTAWTHGRDAERFGVRECARIWFWAGVLPTCAVLASSMTLGWSFLGASGAYVLLFSKITKDRISVGDTPSVAFTYSAYNIVGKLPQLLGQLAFLRRRRSRLIEYKS